MSSREGSGQFTPPSQDCVEITLGSNSIQGWMRVQRGWDSLQERLEIHPSMNHVLIIFL